MSRLALFLLGPPRIERDGLVDKLLYLFLHNRRDQTSELMFGLFCYGERGREVCLPGHHALCVAGQVKIEPGET